MPRVTTFIQRRRYGQKKNKEIIKKFIVDNQDSYYRLAYSYVHNKEDSLDIIQESICKALSSSTTLENSEAVKSWFYRIVVNTSLDLIRKNKHYAYVEDDDFEIAGLSMEDQYANIDLEQAIDKLPTLHKTVVILRYFEDMKIEDIARVTGENTNTTKTRLYAALKKLRLDLEELNVSISH